MVAGRLTGIARKIENDAHFKRQKDQEAHVSKLAGQTALIPEPAAASVARWR